MSVTIEPVPDNTTELKLGAMNVRRASGRDRAPDGTPIPQGTISVVIQLRRHANGTDGQDLEPLVTPDADALVASLAGEGDPLTAEAAARFTRVDADLKWLAALVGSRAGVCERPTV